MTFVQVICRSSPWRTSRGRNGSVRDHFFEGFLWLVRIGGGRKFVGVMNTSDDEFFIHSYGEDGISLFEFFIPTVVGVCIREDELFSHAIAATEDDRATFPVYARVVALEPVVAEGKCPSFQGSLLRGRYARGVLQSSLRVPQTL